MFRKFILPLLAGAGLGAGIYAAVLSARVTPTAAPVAEPAQAPFQTFVAGAGIVEANTENVAISAVLPGVVTKVHVQIGSRVKAGDPLFTQDERAARAALASARAALQVAVATYANATNELGLAEGVVDRRALSREALDQRRYAARIAEAQVVQARAQEEASATDLERLTVRAPTDGEVLQLKVRAGEFATAGALAQPLILFGNTEPLHVRTDVDENDAWRVREGAPAMGYLRGNKQISTPLKFVRFEPYVIPKVSLTGDPVERVDTRVLQVVYRLEKSGLPVFAGQQMDVYIKAEGHATAPAEPARGARP